MALKELTACLQSRQAAAVGLGRGRGDWKSSSGVGVRARGRGLEERPERKEMVVGTWKGSGPLC